MNIAVNAADLCSTRIDGTRIYIKNVLDHLGELKQNSDSFFIYLKGKLNGNLQFTMHPNYTIRKSESPLFWTQLRLPRELKKDRPDVLWMPLQTIPFMLSSNIKTVVTIHDLAFKMFRDHFPVKDHLLLTIFTGHAIRTAARIIAVSENTKKDIMRYYGVDSRKITVVHHGYDRTLFNQERAKNISEVSRVLAKHKVSKEYILYAGAIQPRKNLSTLIKAFDILKRKDGFKNLALVIAGSNAWMHERVHEEAKRAQAKGDIIFTGAYKTEDLPMLMGGAKAFVFPSLYEGFGIPLLEAMACGTAVIAADNSSLPEVGGDAPCYFKAEDVGALVECLERVITDGALREEMVRKGLSRAQGFSWERCAVRTLEILHDTHTL